MPQFTYRAIDADGRRLSGRTEATNLADLELRLKHMGLDFINGGRVKGARRRGRAVSRRELINFCFHLEQLTRAGVPIIEGLIDLRDSAANHRFREVVASLIESISGGKTLSQAMAAHRRIFDGVFSSLVRAGEETGMLPDVLRGLAESLKWQDELAAQSRKLVTYPALLGAMTVTVTGFVMIYLVPKLAIFIRGLGQPLPLPTQALLATSGFLAHYGYWLLFAPLLMSAGLRVALRASPAIRYRFDRLKLDLPLAGNVLRKIMLSRFAGIFAMMYASGIPIIDAIRASENLVGNVVIKDGLVRAGRMITEGQSLTAAFQNVGLFPPLVIRMLRVGEGTGGLDTALLNVSYFYNRDVREAIERLQALIEPLLTLAVGLILGWVMLAALGPVYDIVTGIGI
ncbi:type II secretion system protein F [mine drainage metagenome]|uniref:Type II secretion system protein F n=1 Tax=mine drainage metagenome TaxID=410659 RepID=A0A1J5SNP5_9ZZZZ